MFDVPLLGDLERAAGRLTDGVSVLKR